MKKTLFLSFFIVFSFNSFGQAWNLIWEENFSGNSLDQSVWTHELGTGSQYGLWGWGNGELQFYQSGNAEVSNGTLKIIAKQEPGRVPLARCNIDGLGRTINDLIMIDELVNFEKFTNESFIRTLLF